MSRLARAYSSSGIYHIVFRGVNQQSMFEEKADYEKLKRTIAIVKEEMKFKVYAYCFMSNHVHLVIHEKQERDISLIMKRILTKYARWYNIKYGRSGALIANRYKSVPVEIDEYFLQLIRYVHQNPVAANMVEELEQYPYSSYREYISRAEIADVDFVFNMIEKREFIDFHTQYDEVKFEVSDSNKKSDDELRLVICRDYKIDNPKEISKMAKDEKHQILGELKKEFSARQLQRVTGVCREVIGKI